MESAHDELISKDLWETLGITKNSAVYEFTKAFAKIAVTKYENLGNKKGRGRKFGKIGGELVKLGSFPGSSKSSPHSKAIQQITAIGLQSVADYVDKLMQARTKISIISIINAKSSKSFDETFLLCFIVFALHTYDKYKDSLEYINMEAPGEKTKRENKVQAIQMLAEYAGSLCFSALLKCESKKEDEFLRKLSKKNLKKDFKSQWTAATLVNLYYWAQEDSGAAKTFKKVITPYELFVKGKLDIICDKEDSGSVCSGFNFYQQDSRKNTWGNVLKNKRPENLLPTRSGLIPVKSLLKEDSETLDFSWAPIDLDGNIEKYAKTLHDFLVRDESFSRDVTGTNLVKDLHAKVDEQNSKLNELLEKLDEGKCLTESNKILRFQIQKPIRTFTGRQEFIKDLHQNLKERTADIQNTRASLTQTPFWVIAAPAGIGKTETVRMYIQTYGHEYNHIIWIDAGNQSAHAQFRTKLAAELHVTTEFRGKPKPFETIVKEIYLKMCQNENGEIRSVLIIFDNADSLNDGSDSQKKGIQAYLPPLPWQEDLSEPELTILVTSRNKNWDRLYNRIIILEPWTETDCVTFCIEQLKLQDTAKNQKDAAALGQAFSYNPFILQAATAVILKRQKTSADKNYGIRDLIENYGKCGGRTVLKSPPLDNSPRIGPQKLTLIDLWNVTFTKIAKFKNGDLAIKIISFAAYLSPLCLTPKVLLSLLPNVELDDFEQALDLLENYFVIEQSNNSLAIQPIIKGITKEFLKSEGNHRNILLQKTFLNHAALLLELSTGLVKYLETMLKPKETSFEDCNNLIDNVLAVTSLLTGLSLSAKEFENAIYLLDMICSISKSYGLRMDYNKIIDIYEVLLGEAETRQEQDQTLPLTLKRKIGDVLMIQERYTDAKDIYMQVYTAQKKLLRRDHAGTMVTKASLAEALKCLGDYAGALKMTCAIKVKQGKRMDLPGTTGDTVALTLKFNVATLLCELGEYADALKLLKRVLEDSNEIHRHRADNVFLLQIQTWIARVLVKQEKYSEAIELYGSLMETSEKVRGPHHSDTLLLKSDYATALSCHGGDHETAQNILQEVLENQKRTMGYSMLQLADTENSLAHVQVCLGDTENAIKMYAHVFQVQSAQLGQEHPVTLNTQHAWAHALYREKNFVESTRIFMDVLSGRNKTLGEYHPDTVLTLQYLSQALFEQGDFEMAATFAADIFELKKRKDSLVTDHPHLVRNQQLLDLSITKLPRRLQGYYIHTKPHPPIPPPPSLHLPSWIFLEARSVSNNPTLNHCFGGLDLGNPDGNRFFCFKLKMWTQIIAAVQTILCSACFLLLVLNTFPDLTNFFMYGRASGSITLPGPEDDIFKGIEDGPDFDGPLDVTQLLHWMINRTTAALVECIYIAAGLLLYAGAYYKKQALILIWMLVEGFTIGGCGICLLCLVYPVCTGTGTGTWVAAELFGYVLISLAFYIFSFYIVFHYRRELREHLLRAGDEFNSVQFDFVNFA